MTKGAQATRLFTTSVEVICEDIKASPTAENINRLKEILETWDAEWYNKHRPELWVAGTKAIYIARVTLAIYDKGLS